MSCDMELCPFWTGHGCVCEVMELGSQALYPAQREQEDEDERNG